MWHRANGLGWIDVITGPMFSGKTEELIRRVRRALIARQKVQVFKPVVDQRYAATQVVSHNGMTLEAQPVANSQELLDRVEPDTQVVAIDEAQFFDMGLVRVAEALAQRGLWVIISGLDTDFRGEPFGPMPQLMAIADEVLKLRAICTECGWPAIRTQRLINGRPARYDDPVVVIGAQDLYQPRCRRHHRVIRDTAPTSQEAPS